MAGAAKDKLQHKQEDGLRLFHSPTDSTVQHSGKNKNKPLDLSKMCAPRSFRHSYWPT